MFGIFSQLLVNKQLVSHHSHLVFVLLELRLEITVSFKQLLISLLLLGLGFELDEVDFPLVLLQFGNKILLSLVARLQVLKQQEFLLADLVQIMHRLLCLSPRVLPLIYQLFYLQISLFEQCLYEGRMLLQRL